MGLSEAVDVHQHLWPAELVDRLRARARPPYLRDWTLVTSGERPFEVDPRWHDVEDRVARDEAAGVGLACVSLSAPLGIEYLPRPEARTLLDVWHTAAADLPAHYAAWASVPAADPDLDVLDGLLRGGFAPKPSPPPGSVRAGCSGSPSWPASRYWCTPGRRSGCR